jgi:putative addiction module component (TIGR02574 family)
MIRQERIWRRLGFGGTIGLGRYHYEENLMSTDAESLYQAAMKLPEDERFLLANRLLETVEDEREPGYEEAWAAEITRRMEEVENGTAEMIPWEEVQAKLYEGLDESPDTPHP